MPNGRIPPLPTSESFERLRSKPGRKPAEFTAARRLEFLDAAGALFIEQGFERTSIDALVERAGGSKATIYKMFGSKEGLLAGLVLRVSDELVASIPDPASDHGLDAEAILRDLGQRYLTFLSQPLNVAIFRMVISEGYRFPDLAQTYLRIGPTRLRARLTHYLQSCVDAGRFEGRDLPRIAQQYLDMLRGQAHFDLLLGLRTGLSAQEIADSVEAALGTFLHGHGVGAPGRAGRAVKAAPRS